MTSPLGANQTGNPNLPPDAPHPMVPVNGALVPREVLPSLDGRHALAPLPPALSAAPNALTLFKALQRRLVLALTVGFIVAAASGTSAWFLAPPPKLTAKTQIYVPAVAPSILNNMDSNGWNTAFMSTQMSVVRSPSVLRAVLRDPGRKENGKDIPAVKDLSMIKQLEGDPVQLLEEKVQVEVMGLEHFRITISGDNREELLTLVKAVARAYMAEVVGTAPQKRREILARLISVQQKLKDKLDVLRKQMKAAEDTVGPVNPENLAIQQKISMEMLRAAQSEYVNVRGQRRNLQVELGLPEKGGHGWESFTATMNALPGPIPPMNFGLILALFDQPTALPLHLPDPALATPIDPKALGQQIERDPIVATKLYQIKALEEKIARFRKGTASKEAFLKASKPSREALAKLKEELKERRDKLLPELTEEWRKQVELAARDRWSRSFGRYSNLRQIENTLLADVIRLDEFLQQFKRKAVDLGRLDAEYQKVEKFLLQAETRMQAMEVEDEAPARVYWVGQGSKDENEEPQVDGDAWVVTPNAQKFKLMITAAASLGPLGLILLGFAWLEFRTRKIHSPEEVVQGLGLRLVGTVPDLSYQPHSWLRRLRPSGGNSAYAQHMLTESVDAARTLVLHTARTEPLQIVMITSALAGEGKTSLASHLAASLARAGRRTLLVDCDMRSPALHQLFDLDSSPGLSELLRGETDIPSVLRATNINNLWMVPAGDSDGASLQALAQDGIGPIFQQLRQQYDFIVVDSCPVLPVADSLLVGQHVDAVIFSLLREVSRMPKVYVAYQRLALLGIHMLGAVVNGTRDDVAVDNYRYASPDH